MVWVILGVILTLIICSFLFVPINIRLFTDNDNKPRSSLKFLFLSFNIGDDKKQNKKSRFGLLGFKKLKATKENAKKLSFLEKVSNIIHALKLIFEELLELFPRLLIKRLDIKIIAASDDAAVSALEYGAVCATVYPLIGWLTTVTKLKDGAENIEISCDYSQKKPFFSYDIIISFKMRHLTGIIFNVVRRF